MSEGSVTLSQRLVVDLDKCTGCRACVLACSFVKDRVFNPERARITVLKLETAGLDAPLFCQQCEEPRCVEACPKEAIVRDASGILLIDPQICDNCGACLVSCPYAAIFQYRGETRKDVQVLKCDLCRGNPECVSWCETGALQYVDVSETELIRVARENMVLARKRFEIELGFPLWRYYTGRVAPGFKDGAEG